MLCMKRRSCRASRTAPSALPHDARGSTVSASREKHLASPGEYGTWLLGLDGELRTGGPPHNGAIVVRDLAELSLV